MKPKAVSNESKESARNLATGGVVALGGLLFCLALVQPILARDGDLDPGFGIGGKVVTNLTRGGINFGVVNTVAVQSDGKIVVGGGGQSGPFMVARFQANGQLDSTFGTNGIVVRQETTTPVLAIALQPDGKIVVVGGALAALSDQELLVVRYLPNGTFDSSFGNNGFVTNNFSFTNGFGSSVASAVAIQPDGKIVVVGTANLSSASGRY